MHWRGLEPYDSRCDVHDRIDIAIRRAIKHTGRGIFHLYTVIRFEVVSSIGSRMFSGLCIMQ